MAKSRFGTPAERPAWPSNTPNIGAPNINTGSPILDAVGERHIFAGYVVWSDGGSHDLRSVRWRCGNGFTGTVQISARDVELTAGPPLRDDGVVDQSVSRVNPVSSTNYSDTFSADRVAVATGDELCIVWEVTAYTSGSFVAASLPGGTSSRRVRPQATSFLASVYAERQDLPSFTLVAADGTLGILAGGVPQPTAAITVNAFNSGSTPDECALAYTPTEPHWGGTFRFFVLTTAGGAFDVVLYEGTTAKATKSIDANTWGADAVVQDITASFPDVAFTVGNTYYLAVKPTTVTSVTIYLMVVTSGDLVTFANGFGYATRTDAAAWSAVSDTQLPVRVSLGFVASDGGGGGGLLTHPGLTGGVRG